MTTTPLTQARKQDSTHRRQRVIKAINQLTTSGDDLSVSAVARVARVHRSFIYRHPDLHAQLQAQAVRAADTTTGVAASRQSLMTELANAMERNRRQAQHITQLEKRLSEALGEATWRETGLGTPTDIDTLQRRITHLEQQITDLQHQLTDRTDELDAARATNRELTRALNQA
ncbi:DUF6262 family protein [Saccharopolyspora shandongensis]|uniref:DUF6262 family protein n=1 Tax=Saccharopolyspora shandongensis TaxID=418495 RepID=UPI00343E4237